MSREPTIFFFFLCAILHHSCKNNTQFRWKIFEWAQQHLCSDARNINNLITFFSIEMVICCAWCQKQINITSIVHAYSKFQGAKPHKEFSTLYNIMELYNICYYLKWSKSKRVSKFLPCDFFNLLFAMSVFLLGGVGRRLENIGRRQTFLTSWKGPGLFTQFSSERHIWGNSLSPWMCAVWLNIVFNIRTGFPWEMK